MKTKQRLVIMVLFGLLLACAGFIVMRIEGVTKEVATHPETTPVLTSPIVTTITYLCDADKTVVGIFREGDTVPSVTPGTPPKPVGLVSVVLDNAPAITLLQTVSADGGRYANFDESLVFWSKGQGVLVLEKGEERNYKHCMSVPDDISRIAPQIYHDDTKGFVVRIPSGFTVLKSYIYTGFGSLKTIHGVRFTVPVSIATGTNLSSNSFASIEYLDMSADVCDAKAFLPNASRIIEVEKNGITYSYATSTDAGAGNRYEEDVYVRPGITTCTAIRYFIHTTAIENYDLGTMQEFNRKELLKNFDAIRDSLVVE